MHRHQEKERHDDVGVKGFKQFVISLQNFHTYIVSLMSSSHLCKDLSLRVFHLKTEHTPLILRLLTFYSTTTLHKYFTSLLKR